MKISYKIFLNKKLNKFQDSLQVELNMLEEKYENSIKSQAAEYESKLAKMQGLFSEKEKANSDSHKAELDQANARVKLDQERLKAKYHDDLSDLADEYETKLTNLNLMYVFSSFFKWIYDPSPNNSFKYHIYYKPIKEQLERWRV